MISSLTCEAPLPTPPISKMESCCYGTLCTTAPGEESRGKTSSNILVVVVVGVIVGAVGLVALKRYATPRKELEQPLSSHTQQTNNEGIQ